MEHIHEHRPSEHVLVLTLARPDALNAMTRTMLEELDWSLDRAASDASVHAVVVTGEGRAFSAGIDLHEMVATPTREYYTRVIEREAQMWAWASFAKPLIAAVNGPALGGGAILATVCDIRVGCPSTEFKFSGSSGGAVNNSWQLPLIVGWPMAKELAFTGRSVHAAESARIGLLNRCVEVDQVLAEAVELATQIATNPPQGVMAHKRLMHEHLGRSYADRFEAENAVVRREFASVMTADNPFIRRFIERSKDKETAHP